MPKYRKRMPLVEAISVWPEDKVSINGRKIVCDKPVWLVKDANSGFLVLTPEQFHAEYEQVEDLVY